MSVDVEGIEQLVVIMSQQVQTSGSRLDDADDLETTQVLVHSTACLTSMSFKLSKITSSCRLT